MYIANLFAASLAALIVAACSHSPSHIDAAAAGRSGSCAPTQKIHATTSDYQRYIRGNVHAFSSSSVND